MFELFVLIGGRKCGSLFIVFVVYFYYDFECYYCDFFYFYYDYDYTVIY